MNKILKYQPISADLAILILRLTFGGLFIYHGYGKLMMFDQFYANFPDLIGIGPKLSFVLVLIAELIGGLFVAIGLFTRISVIPVFIAMVVAYFVAHANDPFTQKELAFAYMLFSVVVFFLGSGKWSVDSLIFRR
jgi:putative oxidoreductase